MRTFFATFQRTGSATGTVRAFREAGLLFPRRLASGAHQGEVVWGSLQHSRTLRVVKNPRYAGAFVYGRTETRRLPGNKEHRRALPRESWHTVILGAHPGYISWKDYEANPARLAENAQANGAERRKSPPREGPALLQGLVLCGRCGERMTVAYSMDHGERRPIYLCQKRGVEFAEAPCQRLLGTQLDQAIGELLVRTVSPLALGAALAVHDELRARTDQADALRHKQVERARYEAELAQGRYLNVDPDNRLVAQSLEAVWNHKLRALSDAQEEYEKRRAAESAMLDENQREQIFSLASDFPRLWSDPTVPQRERKRMVRSCQWCGGPVPAKPALRRGKKWCSQSCCLAAYASRKRAKVAACHHGHVA